ESKRNEERALREKAAADAARDRLEVSVARSLLRPLALQHDQPGQRQGLTDPEIRALWELASAPDASLRLRVGGEALPEPRTMRRARDSAGYALHAAAGVDEDRRERVEQILAAALRSGKWKGEPMVDLTLALVSLDGLSRSTASLLVQGMGKDTHFYALQSLM